VRRGEEFGKLWAENCKSGHTEQRGEVTGPGIVADEAIGVGKSVEQAVHVAKRIVEHRHRPAGGFEASGNLAETLDGPLAHGLAGAGVHDHAPTAGRREARRLRREAPVERPGQRPPVFRAMRVRRYCQWLRQQQLRPGPRETKPPAAAGQRQQRVVARIGAGGDAKVEVGGAQGASHGSEFAPRPAVQPVFATKCRPRRDERHELNRRDEAA